MDDEKIIDLFFERSERAIGELDNKYRRVCHKLSYSILKSYEDVEECINDSYLGMWNAIPPSRPNPLLTFLCRIVRNLSVKKYHANTALKRNSTYDVALSEIEGCLASANTVETELDAKELARAIESFLDTLSAENRVIFMRRYWFADSYGEIADRVSLSEKTVSVRLVRIRKQMKDYLEKRGVLV